MSVLRLLQVLRPPSLLHLVRSRVWEKLPVMTLNSYPFDDHKEEESKCIGRYPIPYKKDLPFDIVELMEEIEKKTGFLPNAFKALSYRPSEFRAFFAYYNAIYNKETGTARAYTVTKLMNANQQEVAALEVTCPFPIRPGHRSYTHHSHLHPTVQILSAVPGYRGGLSKADKELIIVVTSLSEKCLYTVVVHSALHRVHSKDPVLSDQVCVNWRKSNLPAREKAMVEFALVVSKADDVTDDHFKKLEMHGFNQEDAWDIAIISAFYAMTRRLINFVNVIPNKEFYSMGRTSDIKHINNDAEV